MSISSDFLLLHRIALYSSAYVSSGETRERLWPHGKIMPPATNSRVPTG